MLYARYLRTLTKDLSFSCLICITNKNMEITTHIVLHTKCIEKYNKLLLFFFNNYRYAEPTHT